jgi:hypothetical protein
MLKVCDFQDDLDSKLSSPVCFGNAIPKDVDPPKKHVGPAFGEALPPSASKRFLDDNGEITLETPWKNALPPALRARIVTSSHQGGSNGPLRVKRRLELGSSLFSIAEFGDFGICN